MITFQNLLEFKITSKSRSGNPSNTYKLYDWDSKQVYAEAGSFSTPHLAFVKLDKLYEKDAEAYGDLGVIKYEGNEVFNITRKNGKYFKSKIQR